MFGCCGNVASVPKTPFISYSHISYFEHAWPKLNFVFISQLARKCATQNRTTDFFYDITLIVSL